MTPRLFSDLAGGGFAASLTVSGARSHDSLFFFLIKEMFLVLFPVSARAFPISVLRCCNITGCFRRGFRLMSCWQTGRWEDGRVCHI